MRAALSESLVVSLILCLSLTAGPAVCREPVYELDTLVVQATRVGAEAGTLTTPVTVLERGTILEGPSFALDQALQQAPGFSLFRRTESVTAHPTTQGVSLRGVGASGSSRSLVLLDGVPLNDPFGGWVHWSQVRSENVERVEILPGGGSQLWGNYALSGVINIISAEPRGRGLSLSAGAGSQASGRTDFSFSDSPGQRTALSLEGGWSTSDGYVPVRADQRGAIDRPAGSRARSLGLKLNERLGESTRLSLRGCLYDDRRDNGTPLTGNALRGGLAAAGLDFGGRGIGQFSLRAFGQTEHFASTFSSQSDDRSSELPSLDQHDVPARELGASLEWIGPADVRGHSPAAGADFRWVSGKTEENFRYTDGSFTRARTAGGDQQLAGLYVQDTWQPQDGLLFVLGTRADRWLSYSGSRVERDIDGGQALLDSSYARRSGWILSPRAGIHFSPAAGFSLRGSFYRTFRAPTLNELYRPFRVRNDITEANPDLNPERLTGCEAGLDYTRGGLSASLTGYWNEIGDAIANLTLGTGPGHKRGNLDRTRVRGIEASIEKLLAPRWRLSVSYLLSDNRITRAPGHAELEGKRGVQVPLHSLTAALRFNDSALFNALLRARLSGRQYEDDLNSLPLAGYFRLDMFLSRSLGHGRELFVELDNVLGTRCQAGRSGDGLVSVGPPRGVFGGLRLHFF